MGSILRRSQRDQSPGFTFSMFDQVWRAELICKKDQERHGDQGRSTVLCWLRRHGRRDWSGDASSDPMTTSPRRGRIKPLTPEQQILALRLQLREANGKVQPFEAMANVLKGNYEVRVVKKASGKSSRKGASKA